MRNERCKQCRHRGRGDSTPGVIGPLDEAAEETHEKGLVTGRWVGKERWAGRGGEGST